MRVILERNQPILGLNAWATHGYADGVAATTTSGRGERITPSILLIRGQRVILDRELAMIYGVQTRVLNQAVRRNPKRFPDDFAFRLTKQEAEFSRSQSVILNGSRGQNLKYLPYAFSEHGAIQAANVLSSPRAVEMGIYVVRAFIKLREVIASNKDVAQKLNQLERRLQTHDRVILDILGAIRKLMQVPQPKHRGIGFTADLDGKG